MPIPIPYEAKAGRRSLADEANLIFADIAWIARLSTEILAEPTSLNLKRTGQLIFHCLCFRAKMDSFRDGNGDLTGISPALIALLAERAGRNLTATEINAEMKALYQAAGIFAIWALDNFPLTGGKKVACQLVIQDFDGRLAEDYVMVTPAPAIFLDRVKALRAVFE